MKLNFIFAWPVLTTIFTAFLYWSAYWYHVGYTEFYSYKLNVFDLSISLMLIDGLLKNTNHVLYLLILLITISFIHSLSREQWKYVLLSTLSKVTGIVLFVFYILKPLVKYLPKLGIINFIKIKLKPIGIGIRKILRKPARGLILAGIRTKRHMIRSKLTESDIQKKAQIKNSPYTVYFAMNFHYFLLLFLTICLLLLFKSAQALGEKGLADAERKFKTFDKMTVVRVADSNANLRNTDICFKGSCLITDADRNVQLYEMKDVKIMNKKVNPTP